MLLMPSGHTVGEKREPEEQMGKEEWNGSVTMGGVSEDYLTERGLSGDLYSCSSSDGGLSVRGF